MFDDFYGLTGRPFQLTPDPNFYFESTTHRKALSYLGYGLAQAEGFIVITGEIGSGKSTLVAHLMQKIDREQMTVGQVVTSNLDGEELVHVAAQSFGLDVEGHDKAAALGAIESFLHDEARAGRRCLLVVDESQNLSVEALEELRMLSNFQLGAHPLLQLLLLGQPEFKQVLAQHGELEQLRQRVIAAHHLEAMEPGEIEPYIKHRLECVGWQGNPDFDQRVFAELYTATGGIPRKVNQVVTRLLLLGAVEQRSRIDNAMLSSVLSEMQHDNAFPEAAPKPMEKLSPAPPPGPVKHVAYPQPAPPVRVEALLAERDAQISELQQAVVELAESVENGSGSGSDEIKHRIDALEQRLEEQERMVRHVLTMMIEWMESSQSRAAA
ncbi:XrtA/PEP-CTERM system-associated ATPase [Parerythrobacter lacustris]|uniref:XrtA-associated ATPase n=1 Tax=Parerythrobacter lacustris TaxID=2969984 RepID=A0ABT1XPU4_9SPHN|nr:XrtA/PEP-CTERM system-associated ATPase [Parerythrobacter lacustris]MCR2833690.1 XrtA-associated ATPase [Parerythrobacter lacustris]